MTVHLSLCVGKIKIVIRAEGSDDPDKLGYCSIKVNGVERSSKTRGHNLVVLDDSGNFVTSRSFDTGDTSRDEGSAMARFLDGLPNERIVLIATQDTKGEACCIWVRSECGSGCGIWVKFGAFLIRDQPVNEQPVLKFSVDLYQS